MADPMLDSLAASELVSWATLSALVQALAAKGVFSDVEIRDIYETALLMIEETRGSSPALGDVVDAARELIEQHLRPR